MATLASIWKKTFSNPSNNKISLLEKKIKCITIGAPLFASLDTRVYLQNRKPLLVENLVHIVIEKDPLPAGLYVAHSNFNDYERMIYKLISTMFKKENRPFNSAISYISKMKDIILPKTNTCPTHKEYSPIGKFCFLSKDKKTEYQAKDSEKFQMVKMELQKIFDLLKDAEQIEKLDQQYKSLINFRYSFHDIKVENGNKTYAKLSETQLVTVNGENVLHDESKIDNLKPKFDLQDCNLEFDDIADPPSWTLEVFGKNLFDIWGGKYDDSCENVIFEIIDPKGMKASVKNVFTETSKVQFDILIHDDKKIPVNSEVKIMSYKLTLRNDFGESVVIRN